MLKFRPHHFLCALGYQGKGYSDTFVANFDRISGQLKRGSAGDSTSIQVVSGSDSICAPCPHRRGESCSSEWKIKKLDDAHAEVLGIRSGDVLSWGEAKVLLKRKMTLETHDSICSPCSWKALGVCRTSLAELRGEVP